METHRKLQKVNRIIFIVPAFLLSQCGQCVCFFFLSLAYFFHIIRPTLHEGKILNTFCKDLFTLRTAGRFHLNMQCIKGDENVITQNIALQNGSIFQNNGLCKHMLMDLHRNLPALRTFRCILVGF